MLLEFIKNHWILFSATALLSVMLIFEETKNKITGLTKISAKDLAMLLNRDSTTALDLRSQQKFADGHILGAINFHGDIEKQLKKLATNKNKTIVLIDDNGTKTSVMGAKLKNQGFTKIYTLAGGLISWKDAGLPLNKN